MRYGVTDIILSRIKTAEWYGEPSEHVLPISITCLLTVQ